MKHEEHLVYRELKKRILILDGAMGTMIQGHCHDEEQFSANRFRDLKESLKENTDMLSITQPQIIKNIHLQFQGAGADIIETNTLNASPISQEDYHLGDLTYELNVAAARLAREAADHY